MKYRNYQQGFTAIIALVLIVLIALVSAYMTTLFTVASISTSLSAEGMQAWFGARSGIEWAIHTALNQAPCTCGTDCCNAVTAGAPFTFTEGGLNGYQATVNGCGETPATEGGSTYCIYNLDLTAVNGSVGGPDYASRRIVISITDRNAP